MRSTTLGHNTTDPATPATRAASEQQVAEDRSRGVTAEREHGPQPGADERVDREQDDQSEYPDARPGEGNDPDGYGEHATQDQRSGCRFDHDRYAFPPAI